MYFKKLKLNYMTPCGRLKRGSACLKLNLLYLNLCPNLSKSVNIG